MPHLLAFVYDFGVYGLIQQQPFTCFHGTRGPAQDLLNHGAGLDDFIETVVVWLQMSAYLYLTAKEYRRYHGYLRREFSNTKPLELEGLRALLFLLIIGLAILLVMEVATGWLIESTYVTEWYRYFGINVLIYLVAIQFYAVEPSRMRTVSFVPEEAPIKDRPADPDLRVLWLRVEERMHDERDYLEADLKLAQLAERLGTNTALLSKAINQLGKANFNDYVNAYRCRAFLERLEAGEHTTRTLLGLALDCGFNSKSTFNRAFRKCYGISPGEALQCHQHPRAAGLRAGGVRGRWLPGQPPQQRIASGNGTTDRREYARDEPAHYAPQRQ